MKARGLGVLAAVTLLCGCWPQSATAPHAKPSPSASPRARTTPLPIDQVPLDVQQRWQALGVTIVPPDGYLQHVDLKAEVINHSGGKVDDATARKWAEAEGRLFAWDSWAVENLQSGLLNALGPSDTKTQVALFGDDYSYIRAANNVQGTLQVHSASQPRVTLVPVLQDLKDQLADRYGYPAPIPDWAFVVSVAGPASVVLRRPSGQSDRLSDVSASYREDQLIVGEYRVDDGTLGPVWYAHTFLSCPKNDFVRQVCRS